jgi:hypothetical protein
MILFSVYVWVIEGCDGRGRAVWPVVLGGNHIKEKALFPEPLFIDEQATWSEHPRRPTINDVRDDNLRSVHLLQPAGWDIVNIVCTARLRHISAAARQKGRHHITCSAVVLDKSVFQKESSER